MNRPLSVALMIVACLATTRTPLLGQAGPANARAGLWGGIGIGAGLFGCIDGGCGHDTFGFSGNGKIGGTLSPSVRLAAASHGFFRNLDGVDLTVGTFTGLIEWHPSSGDLFLNAGVGLASASASATDGSVTVTVTEGGAGFVIGGGADIPVGSSGSLAISPFLNWVITTAGPTYDFFQFGAALTFN